MGAVYSGGSASYVARARCADGSAAVIKIRRIPDVGWTEQVATLERADGAGYVRLLRLVRSVGRCCSRSWGPRWRAVAEVGSGPVALPGRRACAWPGRVAAGVVPDPGEDKASRLGTYIAEAWPQLGRPCSSG